MATITLTDANFDSEIKNSNLPILVDFWAEWCGPCKMVSPILEQISDENAGKIIIGKLNVDENPRTAQAQGGLTAHRSAAPRDGERLLWIIAV